MIDYKLKTPSGKPRSRSIPINFSGTTGEANAITDVDGVSVGYRTLISGEGMRVVGQGPIRTGVTAILPRPLDALHTPCNAGFFSFNGNGEMTGTHWIEESGLLQWPIVLTNTHSCGVAQAAATKWVVRNYPEHATEGVLPVAAETFDGELNDINGFYVTDEHVISAIESATPGPIELGSVGGGTGMVCYDFKGGSGSASRKVEVGESTYTVGVFVQANFGRRKDLVIAGTPVGMDLKGGEVRSKGKGSVIAILATDAPLLPHQLKRLSRRVVLGIGRTGTIGNDGSGDLFLSFSTAKPINSDDGMMIWLQLSNELLDPLFEAVVQATEESVVDSMIVNETMIGCDGTTVYALRHDKLRHLLQGN